MVEIGQQIVGQIREQNVALLAEKTVLSPGFQAQTALIVAKLLDFCAAAVIVSES